MAAKLGSWSMPNNPIAIAKLCDVDGKLAASAKLVARIEYFPSATTLSMIGPSSNPFIAANCCITI